MHTCIWMRRETRKRGKSGKQKAALDEIEELNKRAESNRTELFASSDGYAITRKDSVTCSSQVKPLHVRHASKDRGSSIYNVHNR